MQAFSRAFQQAYGQTPSAYRTAGHHAVFTLPRLEPCLI
ncbi:MAG: AraC family transcriptional regulator [Rhodospirillaceae bacterium]